MEMNLNSQEKSKNLFKIPYVAKGSVERDILNTIVDTKYGKLSIKGTDIK